MRENSKVVGQFAPHGVQQGDSGIQGNELRADHRGSLAAGGEHTYIIYILRQSRVAIVVAIE